ncbi:hypothetical protein HID58_035238 [Brassica napus]|uniref:Uncharacterized protein n=1 Tax=Brassica napus TaxID=3708 RepID=A0ABQ8C596_BRANA|nr:hypothetical protein HID58_035238 [Brassica napus]
MPPTIRRTNNKKESPPPKKNIEPAKKNKRLWRNHNPKSLRRNPGASPNPADPSPADPTPAASPTQSDSESTQSEEAAGSQVPPMANTQDPPVTPLSSRWLEEQSNHTCFTSNWSSTGSPISSPQGENELENDGENDPEQMEKVDTNKKATKEGKNELEVMAANAEKVKKEATEEVNKDVEDSPEDGEALTRPKRLAKPN